MVFSEDIIDFITQRTTKDSEPFYVYKASLIREHCQSFQKIDYPYKTVHFASMANIHPQFLKIVKDEGVNIFVNSVQHMKVALEVGFSKEEIIFTASALSEKTMAEAYKYGVQVNLDSPGQLSQWMKLFPDRRVGLRCNIGDKVTPYSTRAGFFIGKESRLGFTVSELDAIPDKAFIKGLHLYVGTDIFDIDYFIDCYRELVRIAQKFSHLEYLNFGGGFGVSEDGEEQFDFGTYNTKVCELMTEVSKNRGNHIKLILEPGRIIGGEAGYFACQVNDVKKRDNLLLAGVNASIVQFSRPLLYPDTARHPVAIIRNGVLLTTENSVKTTIYGCSTYSRDIFTRDVQLPEITPGDIVVFGNAGSYSASSYTSFLGFPKPEEFFI